MQISDQELVNLILDPEKRRNGFELLITEGELAIQLQACFKIEKDQPAI